MQREKLIHELPKGLIKWYRFHKGSRALLLTDRSEHGNALRDALTESNLDVTCKTLDEIQTEDDRQTDGCYDYILLAGILERSRNPEEILGLLYGKIKGSGTLLLGMDNRLGIRYFCGDRDVFTDRNFDGIENYARINMADRKSLEGRAYAKAEIIKMLENAGIASYKFYSVMPGLERPQALFAEDYLPEEELEVRIFPQYHNPDTVFLEEERLYASLIENGLFHTMANGYFIECPKDGKYSNVNQVTVSMDRGVENALMTVIRRDGFVEKKALYREGYKKLEILWNNTQDLKSHGVKMVDAVLEEGAYVMPCMRGEAATSYFRRLLKQDKDFFFRELDRFWEIIRRSSEHVPYGEVDWEHFDPDWQKRKGDDPEKNKWQEIACERDETEGKLGIILKRGYIDLVSLNCFYINGEFVFYDQEFWMENLPANVIMMRTIGLIYWGNTAMEALYPMELLLERYHLNEYQDLWSRFTDRFIFELRKEEELLHYHQLHRRNMETVNSNRQRMNYSVEEYERLFRHIFRGTEGCQIYLFGSGNFAKKFLSQFGSNYEIGGILDNNPDKWGKELSGIQIGSPDSLKNLPQGTFKVIICVKNYVPVIKQLEKAGIRNYGIYDWNLEYSRKVPVRISEKKKGDGSDGRPKKYHVGYIAGVFDLFHIGHLNMFRRAKEQCDYLIVGVVSDDGVIKNKKTMPYVPFQERIEIVRACTYVDEAVEIPANYGSTEEAYRRYHFDVQFSGSDYAKDPVWLSKKLYLQKHGADMVFFPYTESTSSTKLKEMITKKLI